MGMVSLLIIPIHAGVSQLGVGEGDQLPGIGRVRQDLLVSGHSGVEHDLTHHGAAVPERVTRENRAIGQHKMSLT